VLHSGRLRPYFLIIDFAAKTFQEEADARFDGKKGFVVLTPG
jgi:hypothetical protein